MGIDGSHGWALRTKASFLSKLVHDRPATPSNEAGLLFLFYGLARCKQSCEYFHPRPPAMATDSSSSSTVSSEAATVRPQADPLPAKRGEIGYRESLDGPAPSNAEPGPEVTAHQIAIPARHPADREQPPAPPIANASSGQPSPESPPSSRLPLSFRPRLSKHGVRTSTIFLLVTQGSLLLLTIALWVILARLILPTVDGGKQMAIGVPIHTTFIICTLIQAVLLERVFFRYRAERYAMLHPGEIVPDLFNRGERVSTRLALAPWNRPPLPTVSSSPLRLSAILTF